MFGNAGARSALETATSIRPPAYEKWKVFEDIYNRMKTVNTEEEKKALFKNYLETLAHSGVFSKEERDAIINGIENAGCFTCD